MPKLMILCFFGVVAAAIDNSPGQQEGYSYTPEFPEFAVQPPPSQPGTEYFTFSAPEDVTDSKDVQRFAGLVRPQRVVFIRSPEKNIFSLTAEQLAKKDKLNIFVLRRQTNSEGLLGQLQEIRQSLADKPNVQFIKYRTKEDINRAQMALYNEFESIPGTSHYHNGDKTPVYDFDSKTQQLYEKSGDPPTSTPVIFKIIRRNAAANADHVEEKAEEDYLQYLPPTLL